MGFIDRVFGKSGISVDAVKKMEKNKNINGLTKALTNKDIAVRKEAVYALESLWSTGDPLIITSLIQVLKSDEDPNMRRLAALAIGEYVPNSISNDTNKSALDTLIQALGDENQAVVSQAVISLANIGDPSTVESLKARLKNRDKEIIKSAIESIATLRPTDARTQMKVALEDLMH